MLSFPAPGTTSAGITFYAGLGAKDEDARIIERDGAALRALADSTPSDDVET
jgi:hypothetical protein